MNYKSLFLLAFAALFGHTLIAQHKGYIGGFQFKPMLGNSVFSNNAQTSVTDSLQFEMQQKWGYAFGMTFRKSFTKTLAVESGLRFVQRNYQTSIDSIYNEFSQPIDYRLVAYEIPLKAMVRLRASDNSYFNVSLGVQLDLYPSDVFASGGNWQVEVVRANWLQGSMLANIGWEVHPHKMGIFYTGLSFNQPFTDPYAAKIGRYNSSLAITNMRLNGAYFSLDLRYYFEVTKD